MNIPYGPILTTPSFIPVGECLAVWALLSELVKKMIRKVLWCASPLLKFDSTCQSGGAAADCRMMRAQIVASDASPSASLTRIISGDEPPSGGTRGILSNFRRDTPATSIACENSAVDTDF